MIFLGNALDSVNDNVLEIIFEKLAELGFAEGLVGAGTKSAVLVDIIHDEIDGSLEVVAGIDLLDDADGVIFESVFE